MIAFSEVSYSYGGGNLLSDVSLELPQGSLHFLTGPSGAGKTTIPEALPCRADRGGAAVLAGVLRRGADRCRIGGDGDADGAGRACRHPARRLPDAEDAHLMAHAMQWLRSLVFVVLMYLGMAVLGIGGLPYALISRRTTRHMVHIYTSYVRWIRDDKSPYFKELESELLQGDITEDSATAAVLTYLTKLEDVAKLEPCGIHHVEADAAARTGTITHTIARSSGARRTYCYRRNEYGYWTPWEQIKLEIEDNPVLPYVWRGRLLLFWLRILHRTPTDINQLPTGSSQPTKPLANLDLDTIRTDFKSSTQNSGRVQADALLCWSEYFNGTWSAVKTSDVGRPTYLGSFDPSGANSFDRSSVRLRVYERDDATLEVVIYGKASNPENPGEFFYTWFVMYNTHSLPIRAEDNPPTATPIANYSIQRIYYGQVAGTFDLTYYKDYPYEIVFSQNVLKPDLPISAIFPEDSQRLVDPWQAPFFLADQKRVFYVNTSVVPFFVWNYPGYGGVLDTYLRRGRIVSPLLPGSAVPPWPLRPHGAITVSNHPSRLRAEDIHIPSNIQSGHLLRFGDELIGPKGAVPISTTLTRRI